MESILFIMQLKQMLSIVVVFFIVNLCVVLYTSDHKFSHTNAVLEYNLDIITFIPMQLGAVAHFE